MYLGNTKDANFFDQDEKADKKYVTKKNAIPEELKD